MADAESAGVPGTGSARPSVLHVDVVSMADTLFSGEARFVSVPGSEGALGVYPGHTPLLTKLSEGFVVVHQAGGAEVRVYVAGGFVDVMPDSVTVLADVAVRTKELDTERARAQVPKPGALARALSSPDYAAAHAMLIDDIGLRRGQKD